MIDIKAIRSAAEADIECPHEHYEVPMSEVQSSVLIALCDEVERLQHANGNPLAMLGIDQLRDENKELRQEVERLRLPYDWYPHSKDWRDSPQERGEWLHTMYQQSKRREAELDAEVESLRNGMFNIANQSTEPAIQEFARSYLGDKP